MKDKRIGKTVFPYKADWGAWKHPGTKGLFNETQMDEMNAVDLETPIVLEPFTLKVVGMGLADWMQIGIPGYGRYTISARLIDGEARLVAA